MEKRNHETLTDAGCSRQDGIREVRQCRAPSAHGLEGRITQAGRAGKLPEEAAEKLCTEAEVKFQILSVFSENLMMRNLL